MCLAMTNEQEREKCKSNKSTCSQDMIPPKKHLLRHQPVNAQIGLMDGNTFCTTLEPRLFTIDLKVRLLTLIRIVAGIIGR